MGSPASPESPPVQGLVAGKYELSNLIGRGGMGSVWEGRHTTLGTRVAVKFIDSEYATSTEARDRFDNEARAAATIQSKHAIQIYDHGVTEDGRPYIVMELLIGEPLDKRIERLGTMQLQETARILQQVCRALQRAHDSGIIHRDLKPENIFLVRSPDEDEDIAKVLDFGIAKIKGVPGKQGISSSTKTGAVMGTPYYMSPEQARGLRSIDHRSDLWSLGVIAFKCVTGVLPFEGESVGDLLVKICTSPPPAPSQLVPGLPSSFDAWFFRALEREPPRRFATAQELAEALAYACGISVRGPGSGQGARRDSNPNANMTGPANFPMSTPMPHDARATPHNAGYGMPMNTPHGAPTPHNAGHPMPPMQTPHGAPTPHLGHAALPMRPSYQPAPPTSGRPSGSPSSHPQSPALTAAPFVASMPAPGKPSRGVLWASIGTALIGVSVGAFAIIKIVSKPAPTETTIHVQGAGTTSTVATVNAFDDPVPELAPPPVAPTLSAVVTATAPAATGKTPPTKATTSHSAKPPASAPPTATATATATATLPPPPPLPPPPRPTSTLDPGY